MSAGLMTRTSGTALSASFSMRHRSLGVFLPDLPPRKAQESPCSTCDDLTGAPRESMHIDRCGRRHRIEGQWLFATLLIGRIRLLRLLHRTNSFHPRNVVDHVPFRTGADALRTGKRPARKRRRCPAHCSKLRADPQARAGGDERTLFELFRHAEVFFQRGSVFPAHSFSSALSPALAYASNSATASRCAFT
jgi:hypothetical protein